MSLGTVLHLKAAYQDGTTHIVMSPLEFMQRLAVVVPPPRLHLNDVLAPNAKHRSAIIPNFPVNALTPQRFMATQPTTGRHPASAGHARLLKLVFDIDIEKCLTAAALLKIIAAIETPAVIAKILAHLGLSARAPPRAPVQAFALLRTA